VIAFVTLAIQAATAGAAVAPVAISCTGTETKTGHAGRKPTIATRTRVYIIDEVAKDVSYWNPVYGKSVSLCIGRDKCAPEFNPHVITLSAGSGDDMVEVTIDRQTGTYWQLSSDSIQTYRFSGACSRTAMPSADLSKNKF
jgi:hypothetical protein